MINIQNKSKYQEYNELWESMEAWSTSWEPRMPVWTLQSGGGSLGPHVLPYTTHRSFLWLSDTPLQAWHTHQVASTPGQWGRFPAVFCEYWDLHRNLPCLKYFLLDLHFGINMEFTGCPNDCVFLMQHLKGTLSHQILIISDSFYSQT